MCSSTERKPAGLPRKGKMWAWESRIIGRCPSGQDRLDNLPRDVREAEVASLEAISQPLVVDAEEAEDGRVQVVDVDRVLHRRVAELVGGAVADPAFDPAAGHPDGEAFDVVVPARALRHRSPAELAAPD